MRPTSLVSAPGSAGEIATAPGGAIHPRFEINLLVNKILGERPEVRILQIAWYDKRRHLWQFLSHYHARFGMLPRGCHDLGETRGLGLGVGVIDFDRLRKSVERELGRKARCNARHDGGAIRSYRGLLGRLRALVDRLFQPPSRVVRTRPAAVPDASPDKLAIRR